MAKIKITESQYSKLKELLSEEIEPYTAFNDEGALQSVIDGKRDICFISVYCDRGRALIRKAIESGLKTFTTQQDGKPNFIANVIYRPEAVEKAKQLFGIVKKNNGYLPVNTPEETYVIGILLGYNKQAVKDFVAKSFPDFKF